MLKSKKKYVFIIFLFFLAALCFGLFLVSYTAGLALILGIVLGLLAKRIFWLLVKYIRFLNDIFIKIKKKYLILKKYL